MNTFNSIFESYDWDTIQNKIYQTTATEVERALSKNKRNLNDFLVLISPAAQPYLEQMAQLSSELTQKRFGKTIQMYAPLYLSNECQNICTYCGFSLNNKIKRKTLTESEITLEVEALKKAGFDHVLLVTGEANYTVNINYFLKSVAQIKKDFSTISVEVQPLSVEEYKQLHEAGVYSVLVYQETYHRDVYKTYHTKGKKSNFDFRLETPDRVGMAGMHKIGLGVLLGLEDWRTDSFFNALHIDYLQKNYWQTKYTVSFPRLRPAEGVIKPNFIMSDKDLAQLICAYRLWNEDLEISLSTRENEKFRNNIIPLGITSMSAGSKTNPGGYVVDQQSLEQFEISDERSAQEIAKLISSQGYEPVWKDWDKSYATVD
ncbi:thiamine biosynthesis protein ThiH [Flavobacterium psychrophilum]|uniref:Thiazole biosynthesis protein ThiH n=1 Tax=Flavobacterium psychrophilum (strain ATCC 49511 / DSM 21280 / CIP 103535 / JIP02/86) TaxID=402612 RepID=A6GWS1_FLAPJ|nr:2-iminoacetate synthase ThiH [Flavobacterium psychrophilum]AIG29349.1 thiamine biosynthesis protein ThiH [Flavobacterium psychrophilum]AIG31626.1 thiamine biosynthesis protein ThiH [Flavobacterium psychrophilum]AIG33780.1 thiamine biosynthesis protein ThiH [Flavobacterium psychrophilum]AIG36142.1 thiamine biosynthesis protein ThiH [Flavobacterium psychrophilum]AIG38408.1 thiamine biosynthesis protein ThiH [Flavobacterium psychrophilum]